MKPIDVEEFRSAVEKAILRIKNQHPTEEQIGFLKEIKLNKKAPDKLTIPTAEGFLFTNIKDILYCHAVGNYTEFHLADRQKILSSHTLGYYNEFLSDHYFFRASPLLSCQPVAHKKMYKRGDGGSIIMNNGEEIDNLTQQ